MDQPKNSYDYASAEVAQLSPTNRPTPGTIAGTVHTGEVSEVEGQVMRIHRAISALQSRGELLVDRLRPVLAVTDEMPTPAPNAEGNSPLARELSGAAQALELLERRQAAMMVDLTI